MLDVFKYVWQMYPLLLSDKDLCHLDSMVTSEGFVQRQMEENRRLLMLPLGSMLTQSLPFDPLHLSAFVTKDLQSNEVSDHYKIVDAHIFSKDGKCGIALLSSPYGISESKQNEKLVSLIDEVANKVMDRYPDIIAVLFYSFRRWSDIFWIGISIVFGWLVALGVISVFYDNISIIVLGIGSVIIGIAVNYPLHFLDHLRHEVNCRNALKEMVTPLLIGNVTTVSAFLCLVFIDADAMRDLGIFGSLMLIATIAFVLIILPALVSRRTEGGKVYFILPDVKFRAILVWALPLIPMFSISII